MKLRPAQVERLSLASSLVTIISGFLLIPSLYLVFANRFTYQVAINATRVSVYASLLYSIFVAIRIRKYHDKIRSAPSLEPDYALKISAARARRAWLVGAMAVVVFFAWLPINVPGLYRLLGGKTGAVETVIRTEDSYKKQDEKFLLQYYEQDAVITLEPTRNDRGAIAKEGVVWRGFSNRTHKTAKSLSSLHYKHKGTIHRYYQNPDLGKFSYRKIVPAGAVVTSADGQKAIAVTYTEARPTSSFWNRAATTITEVMLLWRKPTGGWKPFRWQVWKFKYAPTASQWKIRAFRGGYSEAEVAALYELFSKDLNK